MSKARIVKPLNPNAMMEFAKRMTEAGRKGVYIGVPSSKNAGRDGGMNNASLAAIHEFGAPSANIPERSFLRKTMIDNKEELKSDFNSTLKTIVMGKNTPDKAYAMLGAKWSGKVKQTIMDGDISPKTSDETIQARLKRKKSISAKQRSRISSSEKTLIDTGALVGSIDYEVKKK